MGNERMDLTRALTSTRIDKMYGFKMTMQDDTSPVRNIETVKGQNFLAVSFVQLFLAGFPLPD